MLKLYASVTSPFARKARAVAIEKGIAVDVALLTPPYRPHVAAANPLGKIPTLERDDGFPLFDSPVIAEYLDSLPSAAPSLIGTGETRLAVGVWQALADGLMEAAVARMIELRRPAEQQSAAVIRDQEAKIARALEYAAARVGDTFLVGDSFTLADIAIAAALGYVDLRYPHPWRDAHPRLAAYSERIATRPCLATTAPPTG